MHNLMVFAGDFQCLGGRGARLTQARESLQFTLNVNSVNWPNGQLSGSEVNGEKDFTEDCDP